jgi:hypothetical protein
MVEKRLSSPTAMSNYKTKLKKDIAAAELAHSNQYSKVVGLILNKPEASTEAWKYVYTIEDAKVSPDFLGDKEVTIETEQRLLVHRKKIINKLALELINSVIVN